VLFAELHPEARFVQIGSNDGIKLDPLRAHILARRWRGVLVEPIPYLYAQLKANYAACAGRLVFENVAIATTEGTLPFYHLARVADAKAAGLPNWYDALGSFRRDVIAAHVSVIPDIERRIVEVAVPAITFDTLCRRNGLARIDLLHMDTEGYDFELLKSIDFTRHRPVLVIYEHTHLSRADQAAARAYLEGHGYEGSPDGMDTWCLNVRDLPPADRRLLDLWRRLRRS
jgi:FkbM family methyltransferase